MRKTVKENVPLMPATIKLRAGNPLFKLLPAQKLPMKDLESLNIMAQIRQVFSGKSFIWRMNEEVSDMQGVWQGHRRRNSRLRTDGISSVDMKELSERLTFSMMQMSVPDWGLDQGRPRHTGPT